VEIMKVRTGGGAMAPASFFLGTAATVALPSYSLMSLSLRPTPESATSACWVATSFERCFILRPTPAQVVQRVGFMTANRACPRCVQARLMYDNRYRLRPTSEDRMSVA